MRDTRWRHPWGGGETSPGLRDATIRTDGSVGTTIDIGGLPNKEPSSEKGPRRDDLSKIETDDAGLSKTLSKRAHAQGRSVAHLGVMCVHVQSLTDRTVTRWICCPPRVRRGPPEEKARCSRRGASAHRARRRAGDVQPLSSSRTTGTIVQRAFDTGRERERVVRRMRRRRP
jgi:hypothetical protein